MMCTYIEVRPKPKPSHAQAICQAEPSQALFINTRRRVDLLEDKGCALFCQQYIPLIHQAADNTMVLRVSVLLGLISYGADDVYLYWGEAEAQAKPVYEDRCTKHQYQKLVGCRVIKPHTKLAQTKQGWKFTGWCSTYCWGAVRCVSYGIKPGERSEYRCKPSQINLNPHNKTRQITFRWRPPRRIFLLFYFIFILFYLFLH